MKKLIAFVLALACILGLVGCSTKNMDYMIENKSTVTGIVQEVHDDYVIIYSDTADGYPNGSEWQISLNAENKDSDTAPAVGDEIVVYHDGNVMESDPLKVGTVYAITLKTPADRTQNEGDPTPSTENVMPADKILDVAVSYANWTEESEIYFGSLNREKMSISSVQHLPIYRFNTLEELEQFKVSFGEVLTMDRGYDEITSFDDIIANYDEAFFAENTLMLVYVGADNSTHRYWVNSVFCNGTSFCIHVEETTGVEEVDTAMAGWFLTVAIPDSMVENCTGFDADLNHDFN